MSSSHPTALAPCPASPAPPPRHCTEGKGVKGRWSRMEPRFRGSASLVEAVRGSIGSSMAGATPPQPVWPGSAWSRSWSAF
jgi:hypothetical protein